MDQEFNDLENEMASSKETPMIKTPRLKIVIVPCPRTGGTFLIFQNINFEVDTYYHFSATLLQWPLSSGISFVWYFVCRMA